MASRFKSKKEVVYDQLRQEILEGIHAPGTRLVIDEQASRIGVSQIPIREAMRQLEADGFVTIAPHVGATVTSLNANFIYEVFALLESMEVICCRMACVLITDDQLEVLSAMIDEMDASMDNPHIWSQQNKKLHIFLADIAQTQLLHKMLLKVLDHWDRLRYHYLQDVLGQRIHEAQAEHKQILAALQKHDADELERIVRLHNQRALESYRSYLQSEGYLEAN